jgi:hypothetical protein
MELARIEHSIEEITYVSISPDCIIQQLMIRAKHAEELPRTEAARAKNEELRKEMLGLRTTQQNMSHEVEDLKQKRQSAVDHAVSEMSPLPRAVCKDCLCLFSADRTRQRRTKRSLPSNLRSLQVDLGSFNPQTGSSVTYPKCHSRFSKKRLRWRDINRKQGA